MADEDDLTSRMKTMLKKRRTILDESRSCRESTPEKKKPLNDALAGSIKDGSLLSWDARK